MATKPKLTVETIKHDDATRKNIPTAELESVMKKADKTPIRLAYERRNRDLDPQLVWRGKDEQDASDLVVHAPPLYIQEKVHPKVLIDDLRRQTEAEQKATDSQMELFADFNGLPSGDAKTEFYQHDGHWTNRMILGDSLQVMASLAEREGLRGKVQCIYFDPPYGIKFNSNFQWSTTSRDVKDGNAAHITREPEQVKAFRDTWRDGIHSYLTYLRDRLTVARDLLTESGSIFVQIGDENVHRVRTVMDEVFGDENFVNEIVFAKTTSSTSSDLSGVFDIIVWFAKSKATLKYKPIYLPKIPGGAGGTGYTRVQTLAGDIHPAKKYQNENGELILSEGESLVFPDSIRSQSPGSRFNVNYKGNTYRPEPNYWKTDEKNFQRLLLASRIYATGKNLSYIRKYYDFPVYPMSNLWTDTVGQNQFGGEKIYVVQTGLSVVQRCVLMTTDPGDLVLDPTCGSGTTAYVAEQWGRRWITIDTSRVALALARARIMGARYPFYLLADSRDGQLKEASVTRNAPSSHATRGDIRHGFVYERVPHITLKSIANNAEIDVIWDKFQETLEPLREQLNEALNQEWQEWEIPREADEKWTTTSTKLHADWWEQRIARQKEIDASIAAKADYEYLYDKPYEDKKKVRVAGPFTVESLSPHRVLGVDENDEFIDDSATSKSNQGEERDFVQMILENLKVAGVQQAHKDGKIDLISLTPWTGDLICAEGRYLEGDEESGIERRAAIFIGSEFGTVSRADLVSAAREAGDCGFDVLISCAFNYDAQSSDFEKLGRIPVLKARINADLHMAEDLKNTGKGNLFVIFGEPDIDILEVENDQIQIKVNGVDVFHPNSGEVRSSDADGIACWFIDTDYNEESFFVRQAYFLGANDPYKPYVSP